MAVPQYVFLTLALSLGAIFIAVTPPFQAPDEPEHFYRAYKISEGYFIGQQQDNRAGGYLPQSLVDISKFFLLLRWNAETKTSRDEIISKLQVPLHAEQKKFIDFPNTSVYPPLAYFPQALTIAIVRWMQVPPLFIFYLVRLSSLLCWTLLVFQSIKMIPGFKWYVTVMALLPMSLFINASVSADVFTNGISFLLIAFIFRCAFTNKMLTAKDWLVVILLVVLLASSKIIYASLSLLVLIIPASRFRKRYYKYFFVATVCAIALVTMVFWSVMVSKLYIPYNNYNPAYRDGIIGLFPEINMHEQLKYITTNPFYLFDAVTYSIGTTFKMYLHSYVGFFGWLEIPLPVWTVVLAYFEILAVLFFDHSFPWKLMMRDRIVLLSVSMIMTALIFVSQLLNWTYLGERWIAGIQGRYFVPVFPLLLLAIHPNIFRPARFIPLIVILLSVFLSGISAVMIYQWYYV